MRRSVEIAPYDKQAPEIFLSVKQSISKTIPYGIEIEHIGSTAVVGLGGKGIIDILIIAKQEQMGKIVELLESKGYKYNPQASTIPERLFVSGSYEYNKRKLHIHIHIAVLGSREHKDKLLFRDYLRQHPNEARTYYELKRRWSIEAGSDRSKYTELKTSYINEVLNRARREKCPESRG